MTFPQYYLRTSEMCLPKRPLEVLEGAQNASASDYHFPSSSDFYRRGAPFFLRPVHRFTCRPTGNANNPGSPTPECHSRLTVIDPFFGIYFLRYLFQLTPQDQLVTGFYSLYGTNALFGGAYPGSYLLLSPILGYKRHLWAGLYAEYILLPGIAHYTDNNASISANSFEIWNEIHLGYQIDFKLGMLSFYICPEAIVGFDIYKSNEPTSFSQIEQTNPAFHFPNLYVLPNIIIGIKL